MTTTARAPRWRTPEPASRSLAQIATAAQLACLLEASAPKPGNVSPGRPFEDLAYEDFLASAAAIGGPFAGVATRPLGTTIRLAIEATAHWTGTNTNLGIVLLLAPLALAAARVGEPGRVRAGESFIETLRRELRAVLNETTIADASQVYAAIRVAAPGGLGRVDAQDVAGEPTVTLLDAMRLASRTDGVAREYATAFATTFELASPSLMRARADGLSWNDAIVETFLTLLAAGPDTHIVRRAGDALAARVSRLAADALSAGGVRSEAGRLALASMETALRGPRNLGNPGTTADLTTAAVFVTLVAGDRQPQEGS